MKQAYAIAAVLAIMTVPVAADVTLTSQVAGEGLAKAASGQSVTYIKGLKMRNDSTAGGRSTSTLIDIENQRMVTLDHGAKVAHVWSLSTLRESMGQSAQEAPSASLTPNGNTQEIAGQQCEGYDMTVTMGMTVGADQNMKMTMSGPVFIAKGSPGSEDIQRFYLAAAERGFILSDPQAAKSAPQQAQGMTELYRKIAETGGVPYSMKMSMGVEGGGPMAGMMSKMLGNASFSNTVVGANTDPLGDDLFEIPAGYKVQND